MLVQGKQLNQKTKEELHLFGVTICLDCYISITGPLTGDKGNNYCAFMFCIRKSLPKQKVKGQLP